MNGKYEISIWQDVYTSGASYPTEEKICIIGADNMDSPIAARGPVFKIKANGEKTLNFTLYRTYVDPVTGEQKDNPFIKYLVNERKIKLLWNDKWYDLIVKSYSHNSNNSVYSYTCSDAWIAELSKGGYHISFSDKQRNNIKSIDEFTQDIIAGTTWQVKPSDTIKQRLEEGVYEVTAGTSFSAINQETGASIIVSSSQKFLVFYSVIKNRSNVFQFWYDPTQEYTTDSPELKVLTGYCAKASVVWGSDNFSLNGYRYYIDDLDVSTDYRAMRLVESQMTTYDPITDRQVSVWDKSGEPVYSYNNTAYLPAGYVTNLLVNTSKFESAIGWHVDEENFANWGLPIYYPPAPAQKSEYPTWQTTYFLDINATANATILNTGLRDSVIYLPDGLQQGMQYTLRFKLAKPTTTGTPSYYTGSDSDLPLHFAYAKYYNRSTFEIHEDDPVSGYLTGTLLSDIGDGWIYYQLTPTQNLTAKQIMYRSTIDANYSLGIFLQTTAAHFWLEDIELFEVHYNEDDEVITPTNWADAPAAIRQSCWYLADQDAKTEEDLVYLYKGDYTETPPSGVVPVMNENFQKIRTITADKSNRFNLLQKCAETFEAWLRIEVNHNADGSIAVDSNGKLEKYISFANELGEDTHVIFTYGIDLKQISRTVNSDKIATKTIVAANKNQFAPNGSCTIQASKLNPSGTSYIYDLGYYYNQGLLDKEIVIPEITILQQELLIRNQRLDEIAAQLIELRHEQDNLNASYQTVNGLVTTNNAEIERLTIRLTQLVNTEDQTEEWIAANLVAYNEYNDTLAVRSNCFKNAELYATHLDDILTRQQIIDEVITDLEGEQQTLIDEITEREQSFESKYANYITEGTWNSEDYTDPDLYYIDAQSVAYTSSRPEVKYTIDVLRLDILDEFKAKWFDLGDICYVEDVEYFGYSDPERRTPYHEKIVVTELSFNLDDPTQNTVTVQNYRDKFDSLFSKITASVQSLQYNSGSYDKAASIITDDVKIEEGVLNKSLKDNTSFILSSSDNSVIQDSSGITLESTTNANLRTKITAAGVLISKDGGITYESAISANGINSALLSAGTLNAEKINIISGDIVNFRWDKTGINAYEITDNVPNYHKFTRMDQFGFYGIDAPSTGDTFYNYQPTSAAAIKNNTEAKFGLLWDGFFFRGGDGAVSFQMNDTDFAISSGDTPLFAIDTNNGTVKIGDSLVVTATGLEFNAGMNIPAEALDSDTRNTLNSASEWDQHVTIGTDGINIYQSGDNTYLTLTNNSMAFTVNGRAGLTIDANRAIAPIGFEAGQEFIVTNTSSTKKVKWKMTTDTDKFSIVKEEEVI